VYLNLKRVSVREDPVTGEQLYQPTDNTGITSTKFFENALGLMSGR